MHSTISDWITRHSIYT